MKSRILLPSVIIIGSVALATIGIILVRGVQQNQKAPPSKAEEGWTPFEDTDSKIQYITPVCWAIKTNDTIAPNHPKYDRNLRGGTIHQNMSHDPSGTYSVCGKLGQGDFSTAHVILDLTGSGVKFDQVRIGYRHWLYSHKEALQIDGQQLAVFDTYKASNSYNYLKDPPFESPKFACGEHKIEISPAETGSTFGLDFIDVHTCSVATPSGTPAGDTCQGNVHASAKCFKCSDRIIPGQVGILDFACFAKYYGQTVGKP